jgi:cobalt-zinc-cadmium resistance protein CzcA
MDERIAFSISAVFYCAFGIAVLNGIVLIEHFKELKHQGMKNIDELILKGNQIDCVLFY